MNADFILSGINKPNEAPGDYRGEDGLLYCGKCHGAKQTRGTGVLTGRLLSIPCPCKKEKLDAEAERQRQQKADELRSFCLPVAAMQKHTFAAATNEKHIQLARKYVEKWDDMRRENIGLLFWGNTGTGKSFTAQCIANALIDRQIAVHYKTAVEIVSTLMDKDTSRSEFMKKVCSVPLLIIDDIGAERDTAFSREQICAVIDARSESGKPLIVTTNYSLREMDNCADQTLQRIFNRLKAICVPVAVIGESRRDKIGEKKIYLARALLELDAK